MPCSNSFKQISYSELNKAMDCAFGYRDNCTTPLQKELIGLLIEGAIGLEKDFCTPGSNSRASMLFLLRFIPNENKNKP